MTIKSMFLSLGLALSMTGAVHADPDTWTWNLFLQDLLNTYSQDLGTLIKSMPARERAAAIGESAVKLQETIVKAIEKNAAQEGLVAQAIRNLNRSACRASDMVEDSAYTALEMAKAKRNIALSRHGLQQQLIEQQAVALTGVKKIMERKADLNYLQKEWSTGSFLNHYWNKYGSTIKFTAVAALVAWVTYNLYQDYMGHNAEQSTEKTPVK